MDIAIYFKAVDTETLPDEGDFPGKRYSDIVDIYNQQGNFPDLSDTDIAIFGVSEDRNSVNNEGCALVPMWCVSICIACLQAMRM